MLLAGRFADRQPHQNRGGIGISTKIPLETHPTRADVGQRRGGPSAFDAASDDMRTRYR